MTANFQSIKQAYDALARFAGEIQPHRVNGNHMITRGDVREFHGELARLCKHVDAVIRAYGDELRCEGVLSKDEVEVLFTETLEKALDGNALYVMERGIDDLIEEMTS